MTYGLGVCTFFLHISRSRAALFFAVAWRSRYTRRFAACLLLGVDVAAGQSTPSPPPASVRCSRSSRMAAGRILLPPHPRGRLLERAGRRARPRSCEGGCGRRSPPSGNGRSPWSPARPSAGGRCTTTTGAWSGGQSASTTRRSGADAAASVCAPLARTRRTARRAAASPITAPGGPSADQPLMVLPKNETTTPTTKNPVPMACRVMVLRSDSRRRSSSPPPRERRASPGDFHTLRHGFGSHAVRGGPQHPPGQPPPWPKRPEASPSASTCTCSTATWAGALDLDAALGREPADEAVPEGAVGRAIRPRPCRVPCTHSARYACVKPACQARSTLTDTPAPPSARQLRTRGSRSPSRPPCPAPPV